MAMIMPVESLWQDGRIRCHRL